MKNITIESLSMAFLTSFILTPPVTKKINKHHQIEQPNPIGETPTG
ncbi:hypothetical protein [Jeotgalibacillus marinus]|uniref:Uncharacterized protein n=1 Tax=Jeotgalibacillus marinus TaxID=86667 RepID=A0ABV3Q5K3_9BACL